MSIDLRLGRWEQALDDVKYVAAVITDPPYGSRTHVGHDVAVEHLGAANNARRRSTRRALDYASWTPADVAEFVDAWSPRCLGWFVAFTSHDLLPAWHSAFEAAGRYAFAPLPSYSPGSRVRLAGDGPSSWTCWIVVARPRSASFMSWGTLPGGYVHPPEAMDVVGGKPLGLMRAVVRDYSRPGDLVCDPCAGGATTLIAAAIEGRRAIGAEMDPKTHALAMKRIAKGYTPAMFPGAA